MKSAAFVAVLALAPALLAAQATQEVGHPPSESPFRDIQSPQKITLFGGYYTSGKDDIGAAPGSAPIVGVRYEVTVGGPAQFFARVSRVGSDRESYNPALTQALRPQGKVSDPLWLTDVGFSFNLTGQRSWHHLVPAVGFGIGVASATKKAPDDPYRFGTQFSFSTDFLLRYVPSTAYEVRVGVSNVFYQNHYPNGYYTTGADNTALLTTEGKSSYLPNVMLTAGLSVPLFR